MNQQPDSITNFKFIFHMVSIFFSFFHPQSSSSSGSFGHYFDLTRVMDETKLSSIPIQTFSVTSEMAKCLSCTEERK